MKRIALILLCFLLAVCLFGCVQPQQVPPTEEATEITEPPELIFPENIRAAGVDVGCLSVSQACDRIQKAAEGYLLTVELNGTLTYFAGKTLGLTCDPAAMSEYAAAQTAGKSTAELTLLAYDADILKARIFNAVGTPAANASVIYNADDGEFALIPGSEGMRVDMDAVMESVDTAIQQLSPSVSLELPLEPYAPEFGETSPQSQAALQKANDYISTQITYNFTDGDDIVLVTVPAERIAAMVGFEADLTPYIKEDLLREYVEELNGLYGMTGVAGNFKTSAGAETDLSVTYYAPSLDTDALYEDIRSCLEKGISGTRTPPQLQNLQLQEMPFKGSYIEVDLTNQTLYLYKDTLCILETPIVTGCISRYMRTPNGVYKVLVRRMHVILKGEDYETYVKYWMQFYGGYGLHDAYWRYKFGGNEYLYNGSHGCVNIPPDNAEFVFNNISVGYPVVLHGGATNDGPLEQHIVGTEEYNINIHTKPFQLDAKTAIGTGKLTYTSTNPAIATVDEEGTVTVYQKGSTLIRAEYEESRYYTGASMQIRIQVNNPCPNTHSFGQWETTLEPTCAKGQQLRICEDCGIEETRSIAAVSAHSFGQWEEVKKSKCQDGQESKECSVCGYTMNRTIPAQHNLRDWRVRTEPTCDTSGEQYRSCRHCDYEETEVLPALGHSFLPDQEFCENCDATNPHWIPPTEPPKEEEESTEETTA